MANSASRYSVIRVTPTLDTSAYADDDVFFNSTEIPSAVIGNGGSSKLIGVTILNEDDVAHDIDIILPSSINFNIRVLPHLFFNLLTLLYIYYCAFF